MKRCALLLLFITIFAGVASAQSAQSYILSKDAAKYIGKYEQVDGYLYKIVIKKIRSFPDSLIVITYMSELNGTEPNFIEVMKLNMKGSYNEGYYGRSFKAVSHDTIKKMNHIEPVGVRGTIVLYKGKPAIIATFDQMIILEPVD